MFVAALFRIANIEKLPMDTDKEDVYICNGILLSYKKEKLAIYSNMDDLKDSKLNEISQKDIL